MVQAARTRKKTASRTRRHITKVKVTPYARPENTYELLTAIIEVIEEEPLRMDMGNVLTHFNQPGEGLPVCGTVGCIGGWAWVLTRKRGTRPYAGYLSHVAAVLFGAGDIDYAEDDYAISVSDLFYENFPDCVPGTKEYAAAVIKNITRFQRRWKTRLKKHAIEVHD